MTNSATLTGALVRPPEMKATPSGISVFEATLAGERTVLDEQGGVRIKPWYVRIFALGKLADTLNARRYPPGTALYAHGCLDYSTFPLAEGGGTGSTTRVKIDALHAAQVPWAVVWDDGAARLRGGVNSVELSGNLTRPAESQATGTGLLTRATLGVTTYSGAQSAARNGYFTLKGWRDAGLPLQHLPKGAGLAVHGAIVTEPYTDPNDPSRKRTAVIVEVDRAVPFAPR